mmetsp:Transcript_22715/g.89846  ORF Transcript_22715/g.89846 Transcript_22715/m.89846 type:complete len:171 (-) Transcript_22715:220-732(-)
MSLEKVVVRNKDLNDPMSPWSCFTTYYKREIIVQGYPYKTVEHYYQAQQFTDEEAQKRIRETKSGRKAKALAKEITKGRVEDWDEETKVAVMKRALKAKFSQHQDLKAQLKLTQQAEIVFEHPKDDFWGVDKEGDGDNWLGRLLMEIRQEYMLDDIRSAMGQGGGISFNV